MKLYIFIYLFWATIFTEGAPDDYEQRLQPRNLGGWFYGRHRNPDQSDPKGTENTLNENNETKVVPVDQIGPDDKPEPIENLLDELKKKANKESMESKSIYKQDGNVTSLLKDLNKTITDSPTKLAKVFVNKTWRIFDIGALGSTRRTRSVEQTGSLLSVYDFLNWFTQFFTPVYSHGGINQGNTAMHPSLYSNGYSANPNSSIGNTGINLTVTKENRIAAEDFFDSEIPKEIITKVAEYLDKRNLSTEEKFYIILALDQLFDYMNEFENDETKIQLIYLIIDVDNDRRFDKIFDILKSSQKREDRDLWNFFKNRRTLLTDRIQSIKSRIREKELANEPLPDNCFITGPPKQVSEEGTGDQKVTSITYYTLNPKSKDDNYKFCINDDSEAEADKTLRLKNKTSFDDVLSGIKSELNTMLFMRTEVKWLIILKLYKMLEKLNSESDREDDKKKLINLMTQVGNDRHFVRMFESLKIAKDERFHKIWDLFKNNTQKEEDNLTWWKTMTGFYY